MTVSSPSTETIRFINQILAARDTAPSEVPALIASIQEALQTIALPVKPVVVAPIVARKRAIVTPPARPKVARQAVPVPLPPKAIKRRGRPRRIVEVQIPVQLVTSEPEAAPQARLLRRADVTVHDADHRQPEIPKIMRTPNGIVRGVVKWFDSRGGKGALRLTGISGDVLLDPNILEHSGIKRLYKDQEVEATVQDTGGRIRLVSVALPGRTASPSLAKTEDGNGTVRRHSRPVMIEIKRDGGRQKSARAEAEQVFGNVGQNKNSRRTTT